MGIQSIAIFLLVAFLLFSAPPNSNAHAEEAPDLEMHVGIEGRFSDTGWTPVRVRLEGDEQPIGLVKAEILRHFHLTSALSVMPAARIPCLQDSYLSIPSHIPAPVPYLM